MSYKGLWYTFKHTVYSTLAVFGVGFVGSAIYALVA